MARLAQLLAAVPGVEHLLHAEEETALHVPLALHPREPTAGVVAAHGARGGRWRRLRARGARAGGGVGYVKVLSKQGEDYLLAKKYSILFA